MAGRKRRLIAVAALVLAGCSALYATAVLMSATTGSVDLRLSQLGAPVLILNIVLFVLLDAFWDREAATDWKGLTPGWSSGRRRYRQLSRAGFFAIMLATLTLTGVVYLFDLTVTGDARSPLLGVVLSVAILGAAWAYSGYSLFGAGEPLSRNGVVDRLAIRAVQAFAAGWHNPTREWGPASPPMLEYDCGRQALGELRLGTPLQSCRSLGRADMVEWNDDDVTLIYREAGLFLGFDERQCLEHIIVVFAPGDMKGDRARVQPGRIDVIRRSGQRLRLDAGVSPETLTESLGTPIVDFILTSGTERIIDFHCDEHSFQFSYSVTGTALSVEIWGP